MKVDENQTRVTIEFCLRVGGNNVFLWLAIWRHRSYDALIPYHYAKHDNKGGGDLLSPRLWNYDVDHSRSYVPVAI